MNQKDGILLLLAISIVVVIGASGAAADSCSDTDGGIVYDAAGTTSYTYSGGGGGSGNDLCLDGTTLREMYCISPTRAPQSATAYSCPFGCSGGKCNPPGCRPVGTCVDWAGSTRRITRIISGSDPICVYGNCYSGGCSGTEDGSYFASSNPSAAICPASAPTTTPTPTTPITTPTAPTLSSPANGASGISRTPTLDWNDVTGYNVYSYAVNLYAGTSCSGAALWSRGGLTTSQASVPVTLNYGTTYCWHVNARNSQGGGPFSASWTFTTQASTPTSAPTTTPITTPPAPTGTPTPIPAPTQIACASRTVDCNAACAALGGSCISGGCSWNGNCPTGSVGAWCIEPAWGTSYCDRVQVGPNVPFCACTYSTPTRTPTPPASAPTTTPTPTPTPTTPITTPTSTPIPTDIRGYLHVSTKKPVYSIGDNVELTDPPSAPVAGPNAAANTGEGENLHNTANYTSGQPLYSSSVVTAPAQSTAGITISYPERPYADDRARSTNAAISRRFTPPYDGYIVEFKEQPVLAKKADLESRLTKPKEKELRTLEAQFEETKAKSFIDSMNPIKAYKNYAASIKIGTLGRSLAAAKAGVNNAVMTQKALVSGEHDTAKVQMRSLLAISPGEKNVMGEYRTVFNGIALNISDEKAKELEKQPFVKNIYPNYIVNATLMDSVPLIGADEVWKMKDARGNALTGKGIIIAVLDTGVDYTHPDLGGCLGAGCRVIGGYDFVNDDADPMDDNGHGTHVTGIIAANGALSGVAPEAKIVAYKVLSANDKGSWALVISGIERATDPNDDGNFSDRADVLSLSLGGPGDSEDLLSQAVDAAVENGAVVVVAAGNSGPGQQTIGSPGAARKAITVGSTNKTDQIAALSSRGPTSVGIKPDVVAPGVSICSAQYDSAWESSKCLDDKHVAISGTSMAAPMVSGAVALMKQAHPDWSPKEVKMALRNSAKDLGYDKYTQGWGRIDAMRALRAERQPVAELHNPSKIVADVYAVRGTATGGNYALSYASGKNPASSAWSTICTGTTFVENGILCSWDARSLDDGYYTLKLIAISDVEGSVDFGFIEKRNTEIIYPMNGGRGFPTWAAIEVKGTAAGSNLESYSLEWCTKDFSCGTRGISLTNGGQYPVVNGVLGRWNASELPVSEYYYLRLTAYYAGRNEQTYVVYIYVDPTIHDGWPKDLSTEGLISNSIALSFLEQPTLEDMNADGLKDVISAYGRYIYVLNNDGSSIRGWPVEISTGCEYGATAKMQRGPAVADIDKDGFNELMVGDNCGYLHVLNHDGTYLPGFPKIFYSLISAVSVDDINGDSQPEIVFGDFSNYVHAIYANGSNVAGFPKVLSFDGASYPTIQHAVNTADFNGDGVKELVVISSGYKAPCCYADRTISNVYLLDYMGNVLNGWPKISEGDSAFALGDVNDDNKTEIVVSGQGGVTIYSSDGSVVAPIPVPGSTGAPLGGLAISTAGGKPRIMAILRQDDGGRRMHVFENEGGWHEVGGFPVSAAGSPLIADLDGDAGNEISVAGASAFNADGSIVKNFPKTMDLPGLGSSSPIGDIDGDGKNEIITFSRSGKLFVWDTEGYADNNEWPVPNQNSAHTGTPPAVIPVKSLINNTGNVSLSGYLLMKVQKIADGAWTDKKTVVNDRSTNNARTVMPGEYLALDTVWASAGGYAVSETGTFRVHAALVDSGGKIISSKDGSLEGVSVFRAG